MKLNRRYTRSIKENRSFYLSSAVLTVVTLLLYFLFNIAGMSVGFILMHQVPVGRIVLGCVWVFHILLLVTETMNRK